MSKTNIVAYPYAKALFEFATAQNTSSAWSDDLANLSNTVQDVNFEQVLLNPKFSQEDRVAVLNSVIKSGDQHLAAFLSLLGKNNRLAAIPEIYALFQEMILKSQNKAVATIETAYEMSDEEIRNFEQILSKKFGKTITATAVVVPELIGGIKVLINDTVIDASVKGSLEKLATQLTK